MLPNSKLFEADRQLEEATPGLMTGHRQNADTIKTYITASQLCTQETLI